jgi:hypothetical protein
MNFISADEQCETDLVKQLRSGVYKILLPESSDDFYAMINTLTVKKVNLPRFVLNGLFLLRQPLLKEHAKGNRSLTI